MKPQHLIVCVLLISSCHKPSSEKTDYRLHPDCVHVLENASEFEVMSIVPGISQDKQKSIQGHTLLGKTIVADQATRKKVAAAIYQSVNNGGAVAICFDPHHAVRATVNGKTFDFVICFECNQMHVFFDSGPGVRYYAISSDAKAVLDEVLSNAGVPLSAK